MNPFAFFAEKAPDIAVIESTMSSATVILAAEAYGVEPARIAKTLSLRIGDRVVLIVAAGTSRMDNKKVKRGVRRQSQRCSASMRSRKSPAIEVGGVCPFGLKTPLPVYCDVSLKAFDIVVPAAGSTQKRGTDRAGADGGTHRGRMGQMSARRQRHPSERGCVDLPGLTRGQAPSKLGLDGFFLFQQVNFSGSQI